MKKADYDTAMEESPSNAVVHLLKDELGIEVEKVYPLAEFKELNRRGRFDTVECFFVEAQSAEFHIKNIELWEAEWFPVDKPPIPLGMSARVVLDLYKRRPRVSQ